MWKHHIGSSSHPTTLSRLLLSYFRRNSTFFQMSRTSAEYKCLASYRPKKHPTGQKICHQYCRKLSLGQLALRHRFYQRHLATSPADGDFTVESYRTASDFRTAAPYKELLVRTPRPFPYFEPREIPDYLKSFEHDWGVSGTFVIPF